MMYNFFFLNHYFFVGHGPIRLNKILIKIKIKINVFFFLNFGKVFLMLKYFHKNFIRQGLIAKVGNKSPLPKTWTNMELGIQNVYVEILENG